VRLAAEGAARAAAEGGTGAGVLAPDRGGTGTNALLLAPPDCLPFAFGVGSRARHEELARAGGVMLATYAAPGTAFDVDRPADLEELRAADLWPPRAGAVPPRAARRA
jgi:2-phospho-L-lactate guanylyltransferase